MKRRESKSPVAGGFYVLARRETADRRQSQRAEQDDVGVRQEAVRGGLWRRAIAIEGVEESSAGRRRVMIWSIGCRQNRS